MIDSTHRKTGWWMNIVDKVEFEDGDAEGRCCPPHYMPHKLPIGPKIDDEPCHTHIADWRRAHHNFFCRVLKCPNYELMREKTRQILENEED